MECCAWKYDYNDDDDTDDDDDYYYFYHDITMRYMQDDSAIWWDLSKNLRRQIFEFKNLVITKHTHKRRIRNDSFHSTEF